MNTNDRCVICGGPRPCLKPLIGCDTTAPAAAPRLAWHFAACCYLQILDFLTTVLFLMLRQREGNPLAAWLMQHAANPLAGLFLLKLSGAGLGLYCWYAGRRRWLIGYNVFFCAVVVWNILVAYAGTINAGLL